ncbi:kinase-like domain-containing protein [Mycena floridula]|nr:kinase-like domain-containing protein [Mycena floridula]
MLQSDWDWAPVMNSENLRMVLRQELDFTRRIPSASWACALTELLQHEMKYSIDDAAYRALCLQNLRRIIKKFDILPPSFVVHDIVLDEPRRPLFGGGFADVYKGSLKGQHVCLKVLRIFTQTMEMRAKLLKDFCREALLWKQLDHPNVLPFLGVTLELFAPSFCLVSPWMSNGNVMQYLEQNPGFSRINAVRDIAAAMQYLHEHKPPIVHADIRGTNVLVLDNLQCCLADFGLSVIAESSGITGTSTASRAGSVRWMAPEILSLSTHDAELNQTSRDIYAFACTFLEIYTEKHPFPEYRVDFKAAQEVSEGRRPSRPPDVFSDELWDLVEKCWRQDPGHRPSATDVVNSLRPDDTIQTPEQPLVEESWRQNPALRPSATDVVDCLRSTIQTQKHPVSRRVIIYPREFILHFMSICKEKPAQLPPAFINIQGLLDILASVTPYQDWDIIRRPLDIFPGTSPLLEPPWVTPYQDWDSIRRPLDIFPGTSPLLEPPWVTPYQDWDSIRRPLDIFPGTSPLLEPPWVTPYQDWDSIRRPLDIFPGTSPLLEPPWVTPYQDWDSIRRPLDI